MQRYKKYKSSGVEWIGELPLHWKLMKLKYVAKIQVSGVDKKTLEGELPISLCNYLDVYKNDYVTSSIEFMQASATNVEIKKFILEKDDVLATKDSEDPTDIGIPALVKENFSNVICGYHLAQIKADKKNLIGKYLYFLFSNNMLRQFFSTEALGVTRYALGSEVFNDLSIPLPPIKEQNKFYLVLSERCNQIDNCISQKRKLIDLLKEEKKAMLNHIVTKGIDANVPMKPSGIEWIGQIPAHWNIIKLKYIAQIRYGLGQPPKQKTGGLPLIRATNVDAGKILEKDLLFVDPDDIPYDRDPILREDDIVVVRSGAYTADSAIIPKKYEGAVTGYDMVVRVIKACPKFIAYGLLSNYVLSNQLYLNRMRAAQPHLNREELGETVFILPKREEQIEVIQKIEVENKKIDETISKIRKEIELISEYKTSLIYEVVTGKVKVDTSIKNQ